MSRKTVLLTVLAAVVVVAAAGFFGMRMFEAPSDDPQLVGGKATAGGQYQLAIEPETEPVRQGVLHNWIVTVKTPDGQPVAGAQVAFDGGMPQHGHGLPTRPQVSEIGDGRYRVEGVRFNMGGSWVLKLAVDGPAGSDQAEFDIAL